MCSRSLGTLPKHSMHVMLMEVGLNLGKVNLYLGKISSHLSRWFTRMPPTIFFLTIICNVNVTGKKIKELEMRLRSYRLTEMQAFLKVSVAGQRRTIAGFGLGSELLLMDAEIHQLTCMSKNPKIHKHLKDPSRLLVHFL